MKLAYLALAAAVLALCGDTASAQQGPQRPYRGLFGSSAGTDAVHVVTVSGSVGSGYDTSVLADAGESLVGGGSTPNPTRSTKGGYLLLSESLTYEMNKERVSLRAHGSGSTRYYPTLGDDFVTSFGGGFGASWSPTRGAEFSASQTVSYQPFSLYALFPAVAPATATLGQAFVPDIDYNTIRNGYFSYQTSAAASQRISARSAISGNYALNRSQFSSSASYPDFSSQTGGVRLIHDLSAGFAVRVGYGYTQAEHGIDQPALGRHLIDTGVDYRKTLSFSRRTTLSFSSGGTATTDRGNTYFTAIGTAVLNREIGRSWDFNAAYNRNVGFVETFLAPLVYDSANVTFGGLIGRSLSFQSGAGAVLGNVGFGDGGDDGFNSYYVSAGVSQAFSRFFSVSIDYAIYRYDFQNNALLPTGLNQDLSRHSVRASLNAWLPLLQHGRRRNAPR
jgi:hypothetical protein